MTQTHDDEPNEQEEEEVSPGKEGELFDSTPIITKSEHLGAIGIESDQEDEENEETENDESYDEEDESTPIKP